jgi:hypothetical protein
MAVLVASEQPRLAAEAPTVLWMASVFAHVEDAAGNPVSDGKIAESKVPTRREAVGDLAGFVEVHGGFASWEDGTGTLQSCWMPDNPDPRTPPGQTVSYTAVLERLTYVTCWGRPSRLQSRLTLPRLKAFA